MDTPPPGNASLNQLVATDMQFEEDKANSNRINSSEG